MVNATDPGPPGSSTAALTQCAQWIASEPELAAALAGIDSADAFRDALVAVVAARSANETLPALDGPATHGLTLRTWPLHQRRGWQPIALEWGAQGAELTWVCGATRDDLPFHELAVAELRRHPFNRWFAMRTPLTPDFVLALEAEMLPLSGLIFHMSRCGSTLVAQTLKAWPGTRVLSEPGLLDTALMIALGGADPHWLGVRGVLAALRAPAGADRRVVMKLDAWHALALTQLKSLMPGVPWLFAYRDPVEVLVSHARESGRHTAPGMLPDAWLGAAPTLPLSPIEHAARVLGALCAAVLPHARADNLVNHCELVAHDADGLPHALSQRIPRSFGLDPGEVDHARFMATLMQHTKKPGETYLDDRIGKRDAATESLHAIAAHWIAPPYMALEAIRNGRTTKG